MHPVLFEIFGLPISPYGVLIACGLLAGLFVGRLLARRSGVPDEALLDVVFWGIVCGFVGARVLFILVNLEDFARDPLPILLSRQGFVFLGGLLGALPAVWLVIRRWKVRFGAMADVIVPGLALGHAFGRAGCFFAGCCFGGVCPVDLPVAVEFPRIVEDMPAGTDLAHAHVERDYTVTLEGEPVGHLTGSPAYLEHLRDPESGVTIADAHSLPVHPTQLYDVAIQLALFGALVALWPRRRRHGDALLLYLWIYPVTRIVLELFRGDPRGAFLDTGISTSQFISGLMLLVALALTAMRPRLFPPVSEPATTAPPTEAPEKTASA